MLKRVHLLISGKVQGVFFRVYAKQKAEEFGLTGWVKNAPNGKVEILAEGDEKDLKELARWCYNGPSGARVEKTTVKWEDYKGEFNEFKILA